MTIPMHYVRSKDVRRLIRTWEARAREADDCGPDMHAFIYQQVSDELREAEAEEPTLAATSWKERLWTCPPETRLNVSDLAEAMGRPKSWVYQQTSARSIPTHKLDGALVFVAREIREWLNQREELIVARRA